MHTPTPSLLLEQPYLAQLGGRTLSSFTPAEIRALIAQQVALDQPALAHALGDAGLSLYPDSEDMLAISALLAELRQDWFLAAELLERLVALQGDDVPPATWHHLICVLRCQAEPLRALTVAQNAVRRHPGNETLASELASLNEWLRSSTPHQAKAAIH